MDEGLVDRTDLHWFLHIGVIQLIHNTGLERQAFQPRIFDAEGV